MTPYATLVSGDPMQSLTLESLHGTMTRTTKPSRRYLAQPTRTVVMPTRLHCPTRTRARGESIPDRPQTQRSFVLAQSGNLIETVDADCLMTDAQAIIDLLSSG